MTDSPSFIRSVVFAPGEAIVVPTVHVERDPVNGYRMVEGLGGQLPTYEAAA